MYLPSTSRPQAHLDGLINQRHVVRLPAASWMNEASQAAMEGSTGYADLPPELRLRIATLLDANSMALGARLACTEDNRLLDKPTHRSVNLNQPLPANAAACLEASLQQWTLRQKLRLLVEAPKCGIAENVEVVWGVVSPNLFPELLRTDHYMNLLRCDPGRMGPKPRPMPEVDIGVNAVTSGMSHLLPSLEDRCPGLLDPGRTLEAATRHCSLAGLQGAWDAVGSRLRASLHAEPDLDNDNEYDYGYDSDCNSEDAFDMTAEMPEWVREGRRRKWEDRVHGVWQRTMAAAAGSSTPDAIAKMEWVLEHGRGGVVPVEHAVVCGAAAATGDLARLQWLREHGFPWQTAEALAEVLEHADAAFVEHLQEEGGYLPGRGTWTWRMGARQCEAVRASRGCVRRFSWLLDQGAFQHPELSSYIAASHGYLEVLKVVAGQLPEQHGGKAAAAICKTLESAVESGSVPTAAWVWQFGDDEGTASYEACKLGSPAMLQWLLEMDCHLSVSWLVGCWPSFTAADSNQLVEALRLAVATGSTLPASGGKYVLERAARSQHAWAVWRTVRELLLAEGHTDIPHSAVKHAAAAGCTATLEYLVGAGVCEEFRGTVEAAWYAAAAKNGDRATLESLVRLGVPLGEGVLAAAVRKGAPLVAVRWLVEQGAPAGGEAVRSAVTKLRKYYPNARAQERAEVEAWLQQL